MSRAIIFAVRSILVENSIGEYGWQAAIERNGKVLATGDNHFDCWIKYARDLGSQDPYRDGREYQIRGVDGVNSGFVDKEGRYFSRKDAARQWKVDFADKIRNVGVTGDSSDLLYPFKGAVA